MPETAASVNGQKGASDMNAVGERVPALQYEKMRPRKNRMRAPNLYCHASLGDESQWNRPNAGAAS